MPTDLSPRIFFRLEHKRNIKKAKELEVAQELLSRCPHQVASPTVRSLWAELLLLPPFK